MRVNDHMTHLRHGVCCGLLICAALCNCFPSSAEPLAVPASQPLELQPSGSGISDPGGQGRNAGLSSWSLELTLKRETGRSKSISIAAPWSAVGSLTWIPEWDVDGNHLGWTLTLGEAAENLLIDPTITHGPQPCQFYGWQFLPVIEGRLGLRREWHLQGGVLRVLVLDFALEKTALVQLRARCEWLPEAVSSNSR